jgi:hypothetical protein
VIGVPAPFLTLCHCLSGQVARDLIRVARMMLDAQRDTELTKLDKLAVQVVNREVQTLTRGLATRIANLVNGSVTDGLLDLFAKPGWPGHNVARILAAVCTDLLGIEQDTTNMRAALRRHLAMLGVERQALGPTYAPDDWLSSGRTGTGRTPTR